MLRPAVLLVVCLLLAASASCEPSGRCGPSKATVVYIVDGDTVELDSGERVRYLGIDTPESVGGATDCYGQEAKQFNSDLVLDREVQLTYDVVCQDTWERLLAYVSVDGREVNSRMLEYGFACEWTIPPNGEDREIEFKTLEAQARADERGLWGACQEVTCDH